MMISSPKKVFNQAAGNFEPEAAQNVKAAAWGKTLVLSLHGYSQSRASSKVGFLAVTATVAGCYSHIGFGLLLLLQPRANVL